MAAAGVAGQSSGTARQPIVAVCVAAVAGLVWDRQWAGGALLWLLIVILELGLWLIALRCRRSSAGVLAILLAVFAVAGLWHHLRWRTFAADDVGLGARETPQPVCLEAVACSSPRYRPAPPTDPLSTMPQSDESELVIAATWVRDGPHWKAASGKATLSVKGRLTGIRTGDRLRIYALLSAPPAPLNPGERSSAAFDRADRKLCRLRIDLPACVQVIGSGSRWRVGFWINRLRDHGDQLLWHHISRPRAGLAAAVLLGAREQVDRDRNEDFMTTGTVHLLAISGLHVGILAYAFWGAARFGFTGRRLTLFAAATFAVGYALLTDAQPPVVRAAVLVTVMCLARFCGRHPLSFNTLALAGVVVIVINPASIFQAGTQLSFLAVATMACLPSVVSRRRDDPLQRLIAESRPWYVRVVRSFAAAVWQSVVLSTGIWLVALPLVTYRFHLVSPIATVLNPIVCWPMTVALFSGFGVMVFGSFAGPLAAVCGWVCDASLAVMEFAIAAALQVPGNHYWQPEPPAWWVVLFYCIVALLLWLRAHLPQLPKHWLAAFVIVWFSLGAVLTTGPAARWQRSNPGQLVCTLVSVGHGTSVFLELPSGETLLYDAGRLGSAHMGGRPISAVLWSRGITHLDAIVISHADSDHFNAIPYLLERFSVGVIYVSPTMFRESPRAVSALRQAIDRAKTPVRELALGDRFRCRNGCEIDVLHPPARGIRGSDNANSIVLMVSYGGRRLLLPGDLESPGTEELLGMPSQDCDVLMAPHHGSMHTDPVAFAAWSSPEFVVISGGAARDASPVRKAYEQAGATVFHTAFDGAVRVVMDARQLKVQAFRREENW